jgi:hypothetical protein
MLEEEPFDWRCLRRMKGIQCVRSFGDDDKAKDKFSTVCAAWVASDGEWSPLLKDDACFAVLADINDHDVKETAAYLPLFGVCATIKIVHVMTVPITQ